MIVRHSRFLQISLTVLVGAFLIVSTTSAAKSKKSKKERVYRVAITNVTNAQIFSPPVLATHEAGFHVFVAGTYASAELVKVAEDGMNGDLATMLGASPDVFDVGRRGRSHPARRNGVLRDSLERQGRQSYSRGNARQHERRFFRRHAEAFFEERPRYEHTVNSHINRLRAKSERDPAEPRYIQTVWGVGYKFYDPSYEH